ncbi:enediyne antibiotic chromoprotein [Streptomyces yaizuensis]|uniref:Neocarzinostatin n=1 Tax=Streptomyces yaizuensis TaxID=2989713 RepID=A0ABQ5P857_9ACTN|nr:enediyne antibiotic chromoprotein [Streptomyces sp. YSPA8]GLF98778.1 neocarzinostatin [Streptomyces sp. YSPA8]
MRVKNRVAKIVAGSVVALGMTVAFQAPAMAAPTVSVTPSSGLADGAVVQVAGGGLQPGVTYSVGQCAEVEPGVLACNPANARVTAGADGRVSTPLKVAKKYQGVRFDDTVWGTVDCAVVQCVVGLSDSTGQGPAGVPVSFL